MTEVETICARMAESIRLAIPDAEIEVTAGSPGHFSVSVRSASFAGQGSLARQRRVYSSIAFLMAGDAAPVHAIDRLETFES